MSDNENQPLPQDNEHAAGVAPELDAEGAAEGPADASNRADDAQGDNADEDPGADEEQNNGDAQVAAGADGVDIEQGAVAPEVADVAQELVGAGEEDAAAEGADAEQWPGESENDGPGAAAELPPEGAFVEGIPVGLVVGHWGDDHNEFGPIPYLEEISLSDGEPNETPLALFDNLNDIDDSILDEQTSDDMPPQMFGHVETRELDPPKKFSWTVTESNLRFVR